jgi:glycosyltransferase involved in cell wall biosynthesis
VVEVHAIRQFRFTCQAGMAKQVHAHLQGDKMSKHELSVIMPVYNELGTIAEVIEIVRHALPDVEKELVIVDDGSEDGTRAWLADNFGPFEFEKETGPRAGERKDNCRVRVIFHERNKGKGGAVQTGLKLCTGDVIVIQDADLEYDPSDWKSMYDLITSRKVADVVYGSRFYGTPHRSLNFHHYLGNRLISQLFNILFNQTLTDIEVCYKMFTREVLNSLTITCNDFGFDVQISAQIALARRWRIYELGIHYFGRTYSEGKKINWRDGFKALWYLVRFRFLR